MSRYPRYFQKSDSEPRCYHVICRVTQGQFWLKNARVKEMLRRQLWASAEFSGVDILAYCWMSNHIHILIRVPAAVAPLPDKVLLRRFKALYGAKSRRTQYATTVLEQGGIEAASLRSQLVARMHDLSEFMRTWKHRLAIWHNTTFDKIGTLWSGRFKSLWVEDSPHVLRSVAAYIHLNPVRAGIVDTANNYSGSLWSDCFSKNSDLRRISRNASSHLLGANSWDEACHLASLYFKGETHEVTADYRRRLCNPKNNEKHSDRAHALSAMSSGNYIGTESFVLERLQNASSSTCLTKHDR